MAARSGPAVAAALLVGASLLLAPATPASAVALTPATRQVSTSDLSRSWELTYSYQLSDFLDGDITREEGRPDPNEDDDDRCPRAFTFANVTEEMDGVTRIPNTGITQDGAVCKGPGQFVLVGPDVLNNIENATGLISEVREELAEQFDGEGTILGRVFRSIFKSVTGASFKVGVSTEKDRECGSREVEGLTYMAVANVSSTITVGLGTGLALDAGRYLMTYTLESNPASALDNPLCIYKGLGDGVAGATPAPSEEATCFPGDATAELASGASVAMRDLAVGDRVRVAAGDGAAAFSEVYTFTHRRAGGAHTFVTATTASGAAVSASPGHYVYINGRAAPLRTVRVGDALDVAAGAQSSVVTEVTVGARGGLYNPQTLQGDIVVDGVRATTYTTAVEPALASALLAPVRGLYRAGVSGRWLEAGGEGTLAGALLRLLPVGGASA